MVEKKTEIVKQEPAKAAVAEKKADPAKEKLSETAKTAVKKTDKSAETSSETAKAVKEAKKDTTAKKTTTTKKTTTAKTAKKTGAKAAAGTTTRKTAAAKTVKEVVPTVVLQYMGTDVTAKELSDRAQEAWIAEGHKKSELKELVLYVKPEERTAYYVVNGVDTGSIGF